MPAFAYKSARSSATTTTLLSLTANYPAGTDAPAVGDPLFLVCSGNTSGTAFTWTPPSGWTEIGAAVRANDGSGNKNAVQVFWKVHDTGTSATVTTTTFGTFGWQVSVIGYTGSGTPTLVGTAADEVGASSTTFQPAAYTAAAAATVISLIAKVGSGGTLTYTTANGFTRQVVNISTPQWAWGDQVVSAGSVTMPYISTGLSTPWLSKTFALKAQSSGWSVGQIKY